MGEGLPMNKQLIFLIFCIKFLSCGRFLEALTVWQVDKFSNMLHFIACNKTLDASNVAFVYLKKLCLYGVTESLRLVALGC